MELEHVFTVPAGVDATWDTFMDLAGVARCFPGATVTSVEGDRFEGTCKVKLGPIALTYAGSGRFVSRDDEAHRAVVEATGRDKRGNGTAGATVTIALAEAGDGATSVEVTTDLKVTGKPAQFGRGVLQDVSDRLLQQFVECLEQRFAEAPVAGSAAGPAEPGGGPAEAPAAEPAQPTAAEPAQPTAAEPAQPTAAGPAEAPAAGPAPGPAEAPAAGPAEAPVAGPAEPAAGPAQPPAAGPAGRASAGPEPPAATLREPASARVPPERPRPSNVDKPAFVRSGAQAPETPTLDLGAAVLPVLLRSYAPHLAAAAAGFLLGVLVGRAWRH